MITMFHCELFWYYHAVATHARRGHQLLPACAGDYMITNEEVEQASLDARLSLIVQGRDKGERAWYTLLAHAHNFPRFHVIRIF